MATKINPKHVKLVKAALAKAGKKGLGAKGLMKATKLSQEELKPVVNNLVNETEEIEVDGKIMTLAEESDEDEDTDADEDEDSDEDEDDEDEDEAPKKKAQPKKKSSNGKGQKTEKAKKFTLSYATLDTLDEDELAHREKVGVRVAQALNERGGKDDKIAAEMLMRSVGKVRKMLRKAQAE